MTPEVFWAAASTAISTVAVAMAGVAMNWSRQTDRRMVEIEEARDVSAKIAGDRGFLVTSIYRKGNAFTMRVENTGGGWAREVNVILDGTPYREHPTIQFDWVEVKEIPDLAPGDSSEFPMVCDSGQPSPERAVVTWTDDSGEKRTRRIAL